ncbi:MAG: phosphoesterase [Anaerolineae bacterium]|nr:phosphoesterase [Anaerolineae bacterium]
MTAWFTSDTHYGHENIIKHANRPFASVQEMDEVMIQRWNSRVKKGDVVYHLGDFSWHKQQSVNELILRRLNGQKFLVHGNHDYKNQAIMKSQSFVQITPYKEIKVEGQKIILFHYACKVWNGSHRGSWQLFGHSHGTLERDYKIKQLDVGVDCWDFYPISFADVAEEMEKHGQQVVDHHGRKDE